MASVKIVGGVGIWIWISMQLFLLQVAKCRPDTSINVWRCNANEYSSSDPYYDYVDVVLVDLRTTTPNTEHYDYHNHWPSTSTVIAYGHANCSTTLSYIDCVDCLTAVTAAVKGICAWKVGGTVEMVDCNIRYEDYPF